MFNGLCLIVGGGLGLTVVEKIFGKKAADSTTTTASATTTTAQTDLPPAVDDKPQQPAVDSPDAPDQP